MLLKNLAAVTPDGGLFAAHQLQARGGQAKDLSAPARRQRSQKPRRAATPDQ